MRTGAGDVVFAKKAEIDAWLRKQSDLSLAHGESRRWWQGLAAAAALKGRPPAEHSGAALQTAIAVSPTPS
jgi:hypothetical protein